MAKICPSEVVKVRSAAVALNDGMYVNFTNCAPWYSCVQLLVHTWV